MSTMTISVLGLGAMGSRIAVRLSHAGYTVHVWNRTPAAAARVAAEAPITVAGSVHEAVAGAEVALSMVSDDAASRAIWLGGEDGPPGALRSMNGGAVAIEASTVSPEAIADLGRAAAGTGIAFLEAPVVGSRPQAEAGALTVLAGGDPAVLDRVRPVLDAFSAAVHHVGPVGNGATMKLAVNGLFGIQVAAFAEMVGLLDRSGLATGEAMDILAGLPITSPALQRTLRLMAARDFAPNFPVPLVAKDFGYLERLAAALDAPVPVAGAAGEVYRAGAHGGQADLDIVGIADRYLPGGG